MPSSGWMNDPCAPGFDHKLGQYVVSFQWNPSGPDWGDICWGTATSPDLVNWDILSEPTLAPDRSYDGSGVFTGCMVPTTDGTMKVAYTSVNQLPIHHTLQHARGSESLSIATSVDGGRSWSKDAANPILPCEPEGVDVTGWRDPFVARWESMAHTLSLPDTTLFGIISGGIRDTTPTSFLYAIDPQDLHEWRYIGPLANVGLNCRPSRWSGDLGRNWEVTNFVTLKDPRDSGIKREFLIMGTEGCLAADDGTMRPEIGPSRPQRLQLWMCGPLIKQRESDCVKSPVESPVLMHHKFGGHLDHGCMYAANSFRDPVSDRHIIWGWIPEDDLCDELRHQQGWSGVLSLPRELKIQTIERVVRASASKLEDITNIEAEPDCSGTFTVRTLGNEPLSRVCDQLRQKSSVRRLQVDSINSSLDNISAQWELHCSFKLSKRCRKVGVTFGHPKDLDKATSLYFEPAKETFSIERSTLGIPHASKLINHATEIAPLTLFTTVDSFTGQESTEMLEISAWRDNSVLEVFVNGRTAISTRLYEAQTSSAMNFFATDDELGDAQGSELLETTLWDGIGV